MKKLSVYTVNGKTILGNEKNGVVTGITCSSQVQERHFVNYAIAELRGELEQTVLGMDSFGLRSLKGKEKISLKTVKLQIKEAKKQGEAYILKTVLEELRGK